MRQGMRSARVMTFTSEQDRVLWPTLARSRSGQVVLLSSCDVQAIRRWDVFTGRMLWCSDGGWPVNALAVASPPDGSPVVAAAMEDGVLRLNALTGKELDGPEMAADDTVWDVATGEPIGPLLQPGPDTSLTAASAAGGGVLFTAHYDGQTTLWDAVSGEPIGTPLPGSGPAALTCFDGSVQLATRTADAEMTISDSRRRVTAYTVDKITEDGRRRLESAAHRP